jgi:hypothetical protein
MTVSQIEIGRSRQSVHSGLVASGAADRAVRELDRTSSNLPGRGVPPPRSGPPPPGAT